VWRNTKEAVKPRPFLMMKKADPLYAGFCELPVLAARQRPCFPS
jgi:hypothetical protein